MLNHAGLWPFAGRETVDFAALGQSPLFLINGPTGAGKSSILDALCFALYGQTTGAEREVSQMRCDQAAAALLTEVTLDFRLRDEAFRVRRVLSRSAPRHAVKAPPRKTPKPSYGG